MEERKTLMRVALGKEQADLVIKNGNLVNVYSGEVLPGYSVAIKGDKIAFVGKEIEHTIGLDTEVIDASGKIVGPGFIDGHFHPYITVDQFLKHAIPRGTTTIFMELDSLALGYESVIALLENMKQQPIKLFGLAPADIASSAPFLKPVAPPLTNDDIDKLLARDDVVGLGESVWTDVIREDRWTLGNIALALNRKKVVDGHASGAKGNKLIAYVASGVSSCHESINANEALERLRLGLYVMIREGSIRRDLEAVSEIRKDKIDFRHLCLSTDGLWAEDLLSLGHIDYVVQKAINLGFEPVTAIQMATLNIAEHFGMAHILGGIAPGKYADIIILPTLDEIKCEYVISNGKIVSKNGILLVEPRKDVYPESMLKSIPLSPFQPKQFAVAADGEKVTVRVMKLITELITQEYQASLPVINGSVEPDLTQDILKVSVIDRKSGKLVTGFIQGMGIKSGAMACSCTFDAGSPVVVVGTNDQAMTQAINRLIELQGGLVIYDKKILAELAFPIGGLLPSATAEEVAEEMIKMKQIAKELGSPLSDPYMTLQAMPGPFFPFFRITFQGFADLRNQKLVDLIVK